MEIAVSGERLPSRIVLHVDPRRHKKFTSTDPLQIEPSHVTWQPRGKLSRLRYQFVVNHERAPQHYDSRMTADWAIFRAEKMVPRAERYGARESAIACDAGVRAAAGMDGRDAVRVGRRSALSVRRSDASLRSSARLDARGQDWQPQREDRQRADVVVAAPAGDSARRQDTLAFLKLTLPRLQEVFPHFPPRLLIVSAGDPMWRGGLVGTVVDVPALRPPVDQRESYQHAAARAGSHRARHPRRRGKRLDRRGAGRATIRSRRCAARAASASNAISRRWAACRSGRQRSPTLFGAQSNGRHHRPRRAGAARRRCRNSQRDWRQGESR